MSFHDFVAPFAHSPALASVQEAAAVSAPESAPIHGASGFWWLAPICSLLALLVAWICHRKMKQAPLGNQRMEDIAG